MKQLKNYLASISPNRQLNLVLAGFIGIMTGFFIYYQISSFSIYYLYYDPEYAYMFSSLSIFKGQTYAYVDHPGTPLELLGSLILLLTYPVTFFKSSSFINFHLENPIYFLTLARITLLIFSSVTIIFLAKQIVPTNSPNRLLKVLIIISAYYAIHPDSFLSLTLLSHNSINFPGGTFLLLLSWIILKNNKRVNTREKIIIGFVVGVLTAFQLYFSTWVIGAIVSFAANEWYSNKEITGVIKTSFIIGFSSLAGFFIITLPIYKNLPEFFSFVLELATHEGLYGNGREGFTSPQRYLGNLFIYSKILPYLFLTILCLIIALHFLIFIKNWKINPGIKAFTLGIFIQIFIAVSIILKHPMQIYFLSIAAMAPMLFAILIHIIDKNGDKVKEKFIINTKNNSIGLNQISIISIFFIMMILFGINFQTAVNNHILRMERISEDLSTINRTLLAYSEQRSTRPEKINLLWTYETYSPCYARWYGNDYADLAFTTELAQICKNNLHVNLWTGQILTDNGWESPNEYVWDIIVLKAGIVNFLPKVLEYGNFIEIGDTDIAVIVPPNAPLDFVHYID